MRQLLPFLSRVAVAVLFAAALAAPARAQFGQNKVQYRHFTWRVIETAHFKIHYYEDEREAALQAARMAERSYNYLSDFYQHEFTEKIPVILYSSHQDFEQSNLAGGFVSEGTGGFTESLKGRVTLPLTGSYGELNHVLTHELVHAFQFDLLQRSVKGALGLGPLPLWMMEGMAEWVSQGMDPVTAMWIIDAVHSEKKKGKNQIPSVQEMATIQDIRVYRMGQALFEVVAATHGKERIRRILKRPEMRAAMRDSLWGPLDPPQGSGVTTNSNAAPPPPDSLLFASGTTSGASLDKRWKAYTDSLAHALGSNLVNPDSIAERISEPSTKYGRSFHLAPVISPDGSKILYYSSRGFHNELFIAQQEAGKWVRRSLVSGEQTPQLEALPLLSASADWSPDGRQVVFVGTQQGRDALQIFDVAKRRIVKRLHTELLAISNPSWSPDGQYVVFSALDGGQEDLFLIEVATGRLSRLTQDAYSERTPRFAPQGDAIVFATDRGPKTDTRELRFGPWNVNRMWLRRDADGWACERIEPMIESDANDFAPQWNGDGSALAFISDRDGTYQVYTLEVATGEVQRRTRFDAGVVGIVPTGPAFSWSPNGDVAYSVFHNGGWSLYRTHGFPDAAPGEPQPDKMALTRAIPPGIQEVANTNAVQRDTAYHTRLTPEYAVLGALYVGNSGAAGSGQLLLGDMLGNHYLQLGGYLRSELDQSEFQVQYANLGHRWQWGVAGYQYRDDLGFFTAPTDSVQFRSLIRLGVGAQLAYPFSRFNRFEVGLDVQTVTDRVADVLFDFNTAFEGGVHRSRVFYLIPGIGVVHDNASYAGFTPVTGSRWRLSVEQAFGDIDYTFGLGDYRKYFNIKTHAAIAVRGLLAASTGAERQRLRVGGPDTFRGADYGDLVGAKIATSSLEFRFPIFTELLRGVTFVDGAAAWNDTRGVKLATSDGPAGVRLRDLNLAYGFGVRGFVGLPLRIDIAWPTDLVRTAPAISTFSIGFDF